MGERKIQVLDATVADQIAAGEVVERPGSVVKEVLENSLDAGATRITLDIDAGGVGRIRIVDNGEGIPKDELDVAFTRHATSKMSRIEDLDDVHTFGFRGEALPSIASVSKLAIRSRQTSDVAGRLLRFDGGKIVEDRAVGCPVGVDIEITDLFFNTPARLKFLKKESTESSHCGEALIRAALLRPDVAFIMRAGGRKVRELMQVEKAEERVASLFPKERLIRAEGKDFGVEVTAILGPPETARAGAGSLYTYVNGRFVRDKSVLRAVTQAFAGTLEHGRYPSGLISLDLPPGSLDVNVHPQKIEVRFADPNTVFRAVSRVIGEMVARGAWSFATRENGVAKESPLTFERDYESAPSTPGRLVPPPSLPEGMVKPTPRIYRTLEPGLGFRDPGAAVDENLPADRADDTHSDASVSDERIEVGQHLFAFNDKPRPRDRFSSLRYLAQAKELFLLFEDDNDLVVIDQHAAHERVTYEKLRTALTGGRVASQRLLVSHTVDLGPADADRISEHAAELERLGLEVVRSGPDSVSIQSIPAELTGASPDRLLADMVLAIEEGRKDSKGEMEEKVLSTMACHGSIRGGRTVDPREIEALVSQMDETEFSGHCPHGRPVLTRIPWREIRRRLGRS